jgi:hypothetical protein
LSVSSGTVDISALRHFDWNDFNPCYPQTLRNRKSFKSLCFYFLEAGCHERTQGYDCFEWEDGYAATHMADASGWPLSSGVSGNA